MSFGFPNVPDQKGVPPVKRREGVVYPKPVPLKKDKVSQAKAKPKWGIFDGATLALKPDSIISVEPRREFQISDYPVEKGGFESYNKVANPATVQVNMVKTGSEASRVAFLNAVESMVKSLSTYSVVMPDASWPSMNAVRYEYNRTAEKGAVMLHVNLYFQEIRQTAKFTFTATQNPAAQEEENLGAVNPGEAAG